MGTALETAREFVAGVCAELDQAHLKGTPPTGRAMSSMVIRLEAALAALSRVEGAAMDRENGDGQ